MEGIIDNRNKLDEEAFTYKITKDNKVFILYNGKQVITLNKNKAEEFIERIKNKDGNEAQLIMAKATGHFKHGNERINKSK